MGIAVFEAMRAHGMTYVIDPSSAYAAIALEIDADTATRAFYRPEDLIFSEDGTVWVPVEITMLESDFVEAWTTGAKQWREQQLRDQAQLYPTRDGWATYNPVAFNISDAIILSLPDATVAQRFNDGLNRFVRREIADRELKLKARIQSSQDKARDINRLGVLYARYGLVNNVQAQFQSAADIRPYDLALVNLGNICYLKGEYTKAAGYYSQAAEVDPQSKLARLGIARCQYELENYGLVRSSYEKLVELDSQLALIYRYLSLRGSESERASNAAEVARKVEWGEAE